MCSLGDVTHGGVRTKEVSAQTARGAEENGFGVLGLLSSHLKCPELTNVALNFPTTFVPSLCHLLLSHQLYASTALHVLEHFCFRDSVHLVLKIIARNVLCYSKYRITMYL